MATLSLILGTGCSQSIDEDTSKLKADISSMRAELDKARAECAAVRAELEKLKTEVRGRQLVPADRERAAALPGRFAAAMALTSPSRRHAVLGKLATDAAELGDAEITRNCIAELPTPSQKQEVTYQSALRLARVGKAKDAVDLANTLTTPSLRQKALAAIAEGRNDD
jgi:hypothetical protein